MRGRSAIIAGAVLAAVVALVVVAVLVRAERNGAEIDVNGNSLPRSCRTVGFEGVDAIVCAVDPQRSDITLHHRRPDGTAYASLLALSEAERFDFAMNAGMYHEDMTAVGLHVESGVERNPLNRAEGEGNFFLKPNGVFFVDTDGRAGVEETEAFAAAGHRLRLATQSGPMLVVDGLIHPRFEPNGTSRFIRNGVGVRSDGTAVFAVTKSPVSLGGFARLFRDALGCPNALFFDGAVSALHDGRRYLIGGTFPAGPIVAVTERPQ